MKHCPKCSIRLASDTWLCKCAYEFDGSEGSIPQTPDENRSDWWPHLVSLFAVSFAMFAGGLILREALHWTNPIEGITGAEGIIRVVICVLVAGVNWFFCGLIPGLFIYSLYRWRGWKRFRSAAIVVPGVVSIAWDLVLAMVGPSPIYSPDGLLALYTSVESSRSDLGACGCVIVEVCDKSSNVLHRENSHVSDFHGWNIVWTSNNEFKLISSDSGTTIWSRQTDGTWKKALEMIH